MMKQTQFLIFLYFLINSTFAQSKTTKTYYPDGKTESITYIKSDRSTRTIMFYTSGKLKEEYNLREGKRFGRNITYDSLGRKIIESFIIGVDQIPYSLINDTVHNEYLTVDVISSKETNFFPNGNKKSEGYIIYACKIGLWTYYNIDGTINDAKFYKMLKINE